MPIRPLGTQPVPSCEGRVACRPVNVVVAGGNSRRGRRDNQNRRRRHCYNFECRPGPCRCDGEEAYGIPHRYYHRQSSMMSLATRRLSCLDHAAVANAASTQPPFVGQNADDDRARAAVPLANSNNEITAVMCRTLVIISNILLLSCRVAKVEKSHQIT